MATPPTFTNGTALYQESLNAIGLWLVKSQTVGSGVSSVAITNCFNSDYRNYRVTFEGATQSGSNLALQLQFANTTNHFANMRYDPWSGTAGTLPTFAQNFAYFGLSSTLGTFAMSFDVYDPNLPQFTKYSGMFVGNDYFGQGGGVYALGTQLTGFTIIFPGFTNTGGVVKVYGYRD
jgi:hypothetical protein